MKKISTVQSYGNEILKQQKLTITQHKLLVPGEEFCGSISRASASSTRARPFAPLMLGA